MSKQIKITVLGEPVAQGRPRFTRMGHAYDPVKSREYKRHVKRCAIEQYKDQPMTGPVAITMRVYRSIQKTGNKALKADKESGKLRPTVKPDVDNFYKAVSDALTGVVWRDDNQIVQVNVGKWYSDEPRVELVVKELGASI